MIARKNPSTGKWDAQYSYTDWQGKRKKTTKRGFRTKREACLLYTSGQYAENVFFGKPCGLMDQTACAVGGVITIDFKDPAHPVVGQTAIDLAKHGFVMCISDTKGSHADLTDDYAAIRHEMESVAEQFGKKVLREVDEDEFYKALPKLRKAVGDRAVVRAMHFYNDCRRAAQLCDAVREDDFETFLRLIIRCV